MIMQECHLESLIIYKSISKLQKILIITNLQIEAAVHAQCILNIWGSFWDRHNQLRDHPSSKNMNENKF